MQVCQHHAAAVANGSGCAQVLRCSYHGWEYGQPPSPPSCRAPETLGPGNVTLLIARMPSWQGYAMSADVQGRRGVFGHQCAHVQGSMEG